jgi:hypothetical protein
MVQQVGPDLIVNNLDFPGAPELAKRLKNALPPGIADNDENAEVPPQVQQRLAQLDQFAQQATQVIQELTEKLEAKNEEIASKERMNAENNATKISIAMANIDTQLSKLLMAQQYAAAKHEIDVSVSEQQAEKQREMQEQAAQQQQNTVSGGPGE